MKICKVCGNTTDVGFEGVCIDCSTKKRADEALQELEKQCEQNKNVIETEIHNSDMQLILSKMDEQLESLNKISFWVRFWSILSICTIIVCFLFGIVNPFR